MTDGNTRFTFTTSIPVNGSVSQNQTEWIAPQIILLGSVSLIGVLGNLLVIFSIIHSKKLHRHGNIFFVNLAAADLLVTGICMPMIIPNVVHGGNYFSVPMCQLLGYLLLASVSSSLANLASIAVERYFHVTNYSPSNQALTKNMTYTALILTWGWAIVISSTAFSKSIGFGYSPNSMICSWKSESSKVYNIIIMTVGYFIPLAVVVVFYFKMYRSLCRRWGSLRHTSQNPASAKRLKEREMKLMKTLLTTVCASLLFWMPRGFVEVVGRENVSHTTEKMTAWFALSSSAINFIVYGIMNPMQRKGYIRFFQWLLCCKLPGFRDRPEEYQTTSRLRSNSSFKMYFADEKVKREPKGNRCNLPLQYLSEQSQERVDK